MEHPDLTLALNTYCKNSCVDKPFGRQIVESNEQNRMLYMAHHHKEQGRKSALLQVKLDKITFAHKLLRLWLLTGLAFSLSFWQVFGCVPNANPFRTSQVSVQQHRFATGNFQHVAMQDSSLSLWTFKQMESQKLVGGKHDQMSLFPTCQVRVSLYILTRHPGYPDTETDTASLSRACQFSGPSRTRTLCQTKCQTRCHVIGTEC